MCSCSSNAQPSFATAKRPLSRLPCTALCALCAVTPSIGRPAALSASQAQRWAAYNKGSTARLRRGPPCTSLLQPPPLLERLFLGAQAQQPGHFCCTRRRQRHTCIQNASVKHTSADRSICIAAGQRLELGMFCICSSLPHTHLTAAPGLPHASQDDRKHTSCLCGSWSCQVNVGAVARLAGGAAFAGAVKAAHHWVCRARRGWEP